MLLPLLSILQSLCFNSPWPLINSCERLAKNHSEPDIQVFCTCPGAHRWALGSLTLKRRLFVPPSCPYEWEKMTAFNQHNTYT
jgi:hypothetical protein